jgi:preprotein translocase subunit SecD
MKHFKCRLFLLSLTSLLWISGCMADELLLSGATSSHDQRAGRPVLKLVIAEPSKKTLRRFGADNLGQRVEFLIDGRVILSPVVLREIPEGGVIQISDNSWTDQDAIGLARQFSEAPKGKIEVRRLFP